MDYGLLFAAFIVAICVAHLLVRTWRFMEKRLWSRSGKTPALAAAATGKPGRHLNWYCFFRPEGFQCGSKPACPGPQKRKTERPRPRASVMR